MRLIDADALLMKMNVAIAILEGTMKNLGLQDDAECQMELKAYRNIRDGIKDEPTAEPTAQPEPHWIPCSERLPKVGERVLAQQVNGTMQVMKCIDGDHLKWFYSRTVAWMPLPEPYWGGKKE